MCKYIRLQPPLILNNCSKYRRNLFWTDSDRLSLFVFLMRATVRGSNRDVRGPRSGLPSYQSALHYQPRGWAFHWEPGASLSKNPYGHAVASHNLSKNPHGHAVVSPILNTSVHGPTVASHTGQMLILRILEAGAF